MIQQMAAMRQFWMPAALKHQRRRKAHERYADQHRDPEVLFNFISHNSFLRLPLSLLQQCLREV